MDFFTTDLNGVTLIEPEEVDRSGILKTVEDSHDDYPEVYLTHQSGTVVSYRRGGFLIREDQGEVSGIISSGSMDLAKSAWDYLSKGDIAGLDSLPWEEA